MRLAGHRDDDCETDDGGLQQQRHPGLGEDAKPQETEPAPVDPLGLDDEADTAADARAMQQARTIVRAHAINEAAARDPLPSF